jgi:uncharacterized membrane protein YgcG
MMNLFPVQGNVVLPANRSLRMPVISKPQDAVTRTSTMVTTSQNHQARSGSLFSKASEWLSALFRREVPVKPVTRSAEKALENASKKVETRASEPFNMATKTRPTDLSINYKKPPQKAKPKPQVGESSYTTPKPYTPPNSTSKNATDDWLFNQPIYQAMEDTTSSKRHTEHEHPHHDTPSSSSGHSRESSNHQHHDSGYGSHSHDSGSSHSYDSGSSSYDSGSSSFDSGSSDSGGSFD